ncbi:MAG: hypothetical protein ACRD9Q_11350 [Nitrososphaeraceae archaeon]
MKTLFSLLFIVFLYSPVFADEKPMPWTNAKDVTSLIVGQVEIQCNNSTAWLTEFNKEGITFVQIARQGFWVLMESFSPTQHVWYGSVDRATGVLTVIEQGLVSEMRKKYHRPCDFVEAMTSGATQPQQNTNPKREELKYYHENRLEHQRYEF